MADNILRVGTEFDVGPLVAGSAAAGTSIQALAARIAASGLTAQQTTSALQNLGYAHAQAAAAVAANTTATQQQNTTQAASVSTATQLAQAIALLTAQIQAATAAKLANTSAAGGMTGAMGQARVEMGLVEGSAGMMAGGLARVAAQSSLLSPLILAAFPIVAAIALIDILAQVVTAFEKATNAAAGYTKAVQEQEKESVKASDAALSHAVTLAGAQEKLSALVAEQGRLAQETFAQKWTNALGDSAQAATKHEGVLRSLGDALVMTAKDPLAPFEALKASLEGLYHAEGQAADYAVKLGDAQLKAAEEVASFTAELDKQALKLVEGKEAADRAGLSGSAGRVESVQLEIAALKQKQQLEEDIAAKEIAAKGGTPTDQGAARAAVAQEYEYKRIELSKELTTAQREAEEQAARFFDEEVRRGDELAKKDLERITAYMEVEREKAAMFEKSADQIAKFSAEQALRQIESEDKYVAAFEKSEEGSATYALDVRAQWIQANAKQQADAVRTSIDFEAHKAQETGAINVAELEALKEVEAEKLAVIIHSLEAQQVALGAHAAALASGAAAPENAGDFAQLAQWREIQNQIVAAKQAAALKMGAIDNDIKASNVKTADAIESAYEKAALAGERAFQSEFDKVILRTETVGQAFAHLYNDMVMALAHEAEREIAIELAKAARKLAIHIGGEQAKTAATATGAEARDNIEELSLIKDIALGIKKVAVWVATEAAKTAATIAAETARLAAIIAAHFVVMAKYAAEAAAAVYAAVSAIPVVGPFLAPVAAAAAYVAVLAFQQGGIVPEEGMAHVHEKEMMLPSNIAQPLIGMMPAIQNFNLAMQGTGALAPAGVNAPVASNRTTHNNIRVEVHNHGGSVDPDTITSAVRKAMRRGSLP